MLNQHWKKRLLAVTIIDPLTQGDALASAIAQENLRIALEARGSRALFLEHRRYGNQAARQYVQTNGDQSALDALSEEHRQNVQEIINRMYVPSIRAASGLVIEEAPKAAFSRRIKKDLQGTVGALIAEYTSEMSFEKSTLILGTSRDLLRDTIATGLADGEGQAAIGKQISETFSGNISSFRANMTARTETHQAAQNASLETFKSLNLPGRLKTWVPVRDSRTRDWHETPDVVFQQRRPDEPFSVDGDALQFPGDPRGRADNVINCRCVMVYRRPMV